MKKITAFVAFVLLATAIASAQGTAATPDTPQAGAANESGLRGAFPVALSKSLDSKKLKDGDTVVCTTTAALHSKNGMLIPSGTKVIGHITKATAKSKGDPDSSLGIEFDKIELSNKKELDMKGVLQAIAPSLGGSSGPDTGAAGSGSMPGHGGETTYAPGTDANVAGPNSGVRPLNGGSHPMLTSESQGVIGFKNMEMGKDSVITTSAKELKLDNGTQMLVRVTIPVPVQ
jgi:hypothetical protein